MRRVGTLGAALLLLAVLTAAVGPGPAAGSGPAPGRLAVRPGGGWTVDRVRFEPLAAQPVTVVGTGTYRGTIDVVAAPEGVGVINTVGLEDYVRGISEVPPTWPAEAQRAQAIAARTYALWEWSRTANATYKSIGADICATDACQVYRGLARERQDDSAGWLAAVDATAGRAIYWRNAPIKAMYSSSNGGLMVAGPEPYLRAGADADDRFSPYYRWTATYDLQAVVAAAELPASTTALWRDGDTVWASAPGEGGPTLATLPASDFRARLNERLPKAEGVPLTVPTIRFALRTADADGQGGGAVVIEGIGWGHAIGMSQWGAYGKARRGMKADDILAAYYAGLRSVPVPPSRLPAALRVAVELGSPAVAVAPESGAFRVVAGDGTVLAHAATGPWQVVPAGTGSGLRVLPPAEEAGPVPAAVVAVSPQAPRPGQAVVVRLSLPRPAAVTVTATPPGGEPVPVELGVVGPGEVESALPPALAAGTYQATVHSDPGGGRGSETAMAVDISPSAAGAADGADVAQAAKGLSPRPGGRGRGTVAATAVATALLGAVALATARLGRRRGLALH